MNSDKHLYEIFEAYPQWVFELTGRPWSAPCRFQSVTIKAIQRSADGVLIPEVPAEAIQVVEFQMFRDPHIYGRAVVEMAIIQEEHAGREVQGILIFGSQELDPQTAPWSRVVSAYYLDEMLTELEQSCPDHPLIALFQPLIEKDNKRLQENAGRYYTQIEAFAADERLKVKLTSVFIDWLFQRFTTLGISEIEKMLLGKLPDLRETQAGKDLIAIGIEQGVERGELIGTIRTCQSLLNGIIDSEEKLLAMSINELSSMATELQGQLRQRLAT
jgi:hypothetical protein